MRGHRLHAPAHLDAEVLSALGRLHGPASWRAEVTTALQALVRRADPPPPSQHPATGRMGATREPTARGRPLYRARRGAGLGPDAHNRRPPRPRRQARRADSGRHNVEGLRYRSASGSRCAPAARKCGPRGRRLRRRFGVGFTSFSLSCGAWACSSSSPGAPGDGDLGALLDLRAVLPGERGGHREACAAEVALRLRGQDRGEAGVGSLGELQLEAADRRVGDARERAARDALLDVDAARQVERDAFALQDHARGRGTPRHRETPDTPGPTRGSRGPGSSRSPSRCSSPPGHDCGVRGERRLRARLLDRRQPRGQLLGETSPRPLWMFACAAARGSRPSRRGSHPFFLLVFACVETVNDGLNGRRRAVRGLEMARTRSRSRPGRS